MISRKLYLIFDTELGGSTKIFIENLKDDITLADASVVAEEIIAQNTFYSSTGDLKEFKGAQIITTTTESLL